MIGYVHHASLTLLMSAFVFTLSGCAEEEDSTDTRPEVGDWFACIDESCVELNDDGFRLREDGTWWELEAEGARLEPGQPYCQNPWPAAPETYTYTSGTLLISGTGGWLGCADTGCELSIEGDIAQIVLEDQRSFLLKRVSSGSVDTCF